MPLLLHNTSSILHILFRANHKLKQMIIRAINRRNSTILTQMYSQAFIPSTYQGSIPIIHPVHHKFRKDITNKVDTLNPEKKVRLKVGSLNCDNSLVAKSSLKLCLIKNIKGLKLQYNLLTTIDKWMELRLVLTNYQALFLECYVKTKYI